MALPYTTPPASRPGTPLSTSRPGTPSKFARSFPFPLTSLVQDSSNAAVLEKQQYLSTNARGYGGHNHGGRGRIGQHFTAIHLSIPRTGKALVLPIPSVLLKDSPRTPSHLTSRRSPGGASHSNRPLHYQSTRKRPSLLGWLVIVLLTFFTLLRLKHHRPNINIPFVPNSTNILTDDQIARLWKWEISRGHYPSSRRTPPLVNLAGVGNPGVDASSWDYHPLPGDVQKAGLPKGPSRFPAQFPGAEALRPHGPKREYLNIINPQAPSSNAHLPSAYPPRPQPGSIIDLDLVMDHCDFTTHQYVRDCLEMLRTASGLDNQHRLRRGKMDSWKHLYKEERTLKTADAVSGNVRTDGQDIMESLGYTQKDPRSLNAAAARDHQKPFSMEQHTSIADHPPDLSQRQNIVGFGSEAKPHPTHPTADPMCDPDYPHIFHIFWAGPFTDKPYLAVMSFLFTQNLGLQYHPDSQEMQDLLQTTCRPQLWIWVNPGPAASLPNPRARSQMFDSLRDNPWSAPFLHDRFSSAIKFRMWNTTEQLDNIPELRDHWRQLPLFNSGGVKFGTPSNSADTAQEDDSEVDSNSVTERESIVPEKQEEERGRFGTDAVGSAADRVDEALQVKGGALNATAAPESSRRRHPSITSPSKPKKKEDDMLNRVGSSSSSGYDRLTVVLSDMARFVLTHRFGGVYLDADTIFLRDWEELWGWKGAFAYRWSRLEKYNTAVLKMHRNSAIGSFLFKSALANGLDFHPMTISRYTKDANVEGLLLRLPDALFDSAWLNTEYYQRDRPPYPYFKRFEDVSTLAELVRCHTDDVFSSSIRQAKTALHLSHLVSKASSEVLSATISTISGGFLSILRGTGQTWAGVSQTGRRRRERRPCKLAWQQKLPRLPRQMTRGGSHRLLSRRRAE